MDYKEIYNKLLEMCKEKGMPVQGNYHSGLCPYIQFIRFDALEKKDWPNGISDNSIMIDFKIDFNSHSVEIFRSGHIWLTKEDQAKSYLCMCGMKKAVGAVGQKWFRKQSWKDEKDLVNKMTNFYTTTIQNIDKVTGGYPYKQMIVNIY